MNVGYVTREVFLRRESDGLGMSAKVAGLWCYRGSCFGCFNCIVDAG